MYLIVNVSIVALWYFTLKSLFMLLDAKEIKQCELNCNAILIFKIGNRKLNAISLITKIKHL